MQNKEKIGILGGTFNPIHIAHLIMAEYALEELNLDRILFMPSGNPPHKDKNLIISNDDRKAMIELAINSNEKFIFSDIELNRSGKIYTVDTLRILKETNPDNEYYFIMGEDSLLYFDNWKEPENIVKLANIVVARRNSGSSCIPTKNNISEINKESDKELLEKKAFLEKEYNTDIFFLNMPNIDISSTVIRDRIKSDKSINYLVPKEVLNYIKEKNLYK